MPFKPERGLFYRMPVFFGPKPGPRQWPAGRTFDFSRTPRRKVVGVTFLSDARRLQAMLPDCFGLWGEPRVTVEATYMTEIGWLAGRGYNMCDVKFEAVYKGAEGLVHGTLVLVRWENLADPILSGREELGHNKLYCEIPELRALDGRLSTTLTWLGTPFLDLSVSDLTDAPAFGRDPLHRGMLSYKYVPRTGEWGTADVEYATLSPHATAVQSVAWRKTGQGDVRFRPATWEELPTLYTIVNHLSELDNLGVVGAYAYEQAGGASQAETRRLN
jgi:hypothetical protein